MLGVYFREIKLGELLFENGRYVYRAIPANVKKAGPVFDLPIAIAILTSTGQIVEGKYKEFIILKSYEEIDEFYGSVKQKVENEKI